MADNRMNVYNNSDVLSVITKAGMTAKIVEISYKDLKNQVTQREVEPYEVKNGMLWAYSIEKGGIRQFLLPNIISAKITNKTFIPKWPVKF